MVVGRESEIALLVERLGDGRPVAVLGEAGVGKTTLVRVAAERYGRRLVEAGALATLSWLPFLPLRRAFGHDFDGDAAYVGAAVEAELGDAVLLVDDLQWADMQTASLLPFLAGRVPLVAALRRGDSGTPAALEAATAAGLELLPLAPLADPDAATLARSLHPDLSKTATERLVERSGGNPFLLEQLAATGEPSESLRLAVAARLRALTPAGRDAIASLALLGRPADERLLGHGAVEIVAAGLATASGEVSIRHALLAEATTEMLAEDERRRVHARLGAALDNPGESARHHAAAGERALAHKQALLAAKRATTPGERAADLALAASCADGAEADTLRIRAAQLLVEVGRYDSAESLLAGMHLGDPLLRARCALIRSQALAATRDVRAAVAALAESGDIQAETQVGVRLAVQRVSLELDDSNNPGETLEHAHAALGLARKLSRCEAEALHVLGVAKMEAGRDDWPADLRASMTAARASGDVGLECRAAEALASMLFSTGRAEAGRRVAVGMTRRARELNLAGWERRFRTRIAWIDFHRGRFRRSAEDGAALLEEGLEPWQRFLVAYITAQASIDLGRDQRARELIEVLTSRVAGDQQERQRLWVLADAEFWAGRPRKAIAFAEEALARFPNRTSTFLHLTRGWAYLDLGLDPGDPTIAPFALLLSGARPELDGIALLARGQHEQSAERFFEAAASWAGRHVRGELRCLWAGGEALRRAGRVEEAVERLLLAESRADAHEHEPLLGRVRRSLRLAGVRRTAARTGARSGLTGREAQVLELAGEGLTNDEIARRLGVGRPTIVRLIRSAQQKLGATSRTQASALAARL